MALRNCVGEYPVHADEQLALTVPLNKVHRGVELQQVFERCAGHRSGPHIAAYDDLGHASLPDLCEHCLESREVPVNVIEGRNPLRRQLTLA